MAEPDDRSPQDGPDGPNPWDHAQDGREPWDHAQNGPQDGHDGRNGGSRNGPQDGPEDDTLEPQNEPQNGSQDGPQPWDVPRQDWSDAEKTQQSRGTGQGAAWVIIALIVVCCVLLVAAVGSVVSSHQDQLSSAVSAVTGRGSSSGSSKSKHPSESKDTSKSQNSSKSHSPSKPGEQKSKKKATGSRSDGSDSSDSQDSGSDTGAGAGSDGGGDAGSGSLADGTDALPDGFEDTAGTEGISVANWRKIKLGEATGSTRQQVERLLGKPEDVSTSTAAGKKRVFLVWRTYRDGRRIRGATVDLRDGHALYKQIINFRTENDGTVTRGQHDRIAKDQSRQQVAAIAGRPDYLSRMNSGGTPTETWTYGNNAKGGIRFTVTFLRGSVISVSSVIEGK